VEIHRRLSAKSTIFQPLLLVDSKMMAAVQRLKIAIQDDIGIEAAGPLV
jgi:hypothetical protein